MNDTRAEKRTTDTLAIAALIFGLLSIGALAWAAASRWGLLSEGAVFEWGFPAVILGAVGIFLGLWSHRRIRDSGGRLGGTVMATFGIVVGGYAALVGGFVFLHVMAILSTGQV